MTEEITPVQRPVTEVEVKEQPRDTPKSVCDIQPESGIGTLGYANALLAVATATQILSGSQIGDFAHATDMTGFTEEQHIARVAEPFPSTVERVLESEAEATNRSRLELLARRYVTKQLSPEEDARLAILTEKIRRLIPRVTIEDFERLESMAEESDAIRIRNEERRQRLAN
jgi:hypothetical protein